MAISMFRVAQWALPHAMVLDVLIWKKSKLYFSQRHLRMFFCNWIRLNELTPSTSESLVETAAERSVFNSLLPRQLCSTQNTTELSYS
jgi:hypothetical protein